VQPVRVADVSIVGDHDKTIQINIVGSGSLSAGQNQTILNNTLRSIAEQGYTLQGSTIVTGRHTYTVTIV